MSYKFDEDGGHYIIDDYGCNVRAIQVIPQSEDETTAYFYSLDILTKFNDPSEESTGVFDLENIEEASILEIHSQKYYNEPEDALMDGFGALEYLGFGGNQKIPMIIQNWNSKNEDYDSVNVEFDGKDVKYLQNDDE